jgi:hypothetical protein
VYGPGWTAMITGRGDGLSPLGAAPVIQNLTPNTVRGGLGPESMPPGGARRNSRSKQSSGGSIG